MKIDGLLAQADLASVAEQAKRMEGVGYDGLFAGETARDPFLPLALAAEHTDRLEVGTSIAVAFPRSPMQLAQVCHDLQTYSQGRFIVGLGSQVKAHIEKRFSSPWSRPAERMREFILAVRAIWECWNEGVPLRFEGEFYRHTLMTPFFNPGPTGYGPPQVYLAAVGSRMAEVAGEVADGIFLHGFTTERYIQEQVLPALERGLARAGRTRADIVLARPLMVAMGETDQELERAVEAVRKQIAFYASTPAYRIVLEAHDWGDLQSELNVLSKRGRWDEMGERIPDEVLDAFAIRGALHELPEQLRDRLGSNPDRLSFSAPDRQDPEAWADLVTALKAELAPMG